MVLMLENMSEERAITILSWKYEPPYDFYNNEITDENMKELLDGTYYAIVNDDKQLVGFYCTGESAQVPKAKRIGLYSDDAIDLGLGMMPNLVGKGNGFHFCSFILRAIEDKYKGIPIRLTVAKFNQRAIHLYEKLGFVKKDEFNTDFAEFMTMVIK